MKYNILMLKAWEFSIQDFPVFSDQIYWTTPMVIPVTDGLTLHSTLTSTGPKLFYEMSFLIENWNYFSKCAWELSGICKKVSFKVGTHEAISCSNFC